jgi:hypothetical protein
MKTIFKFKWMFAAALMLAVLTGCSKDDDDNNGGSGGNETGLFQEKSGKVVYSDGSIFIFDEYGKKARYESESGYVQIIDDIAHKAYTIYVSQQIYEEETYTSPGEELLNSISMSHYFSTLGYDNTGTKTIAGKSCTTYSYSYAGYTYEIGGWHNILFYEKASMSGYDLYENSATSFSSTIPGDSFSVPANYTQAY